MKYAYVRVSTASQNIDRQMEEMFRQDIEFKNIFIDYQSGKDFERKNYQKLIKRLKKDDLLVIKSIDRLGRDYNMILDEWKKITKIIEADIMVIDMPLLDTRVEGKNLVGKFISDIVLQVLSFVAQNERENIKQRQAEGIRIAKAKGVHMGRPNYVLPNNYEHVINKYIKREINNKEAQQLLNMSRGTFFKYLKIYKETR
ncbi:MAG TPA: resolvase [Firmicutes bacterium]|nr:resolvase [Bacillota bacterium]HAX00126.1 resolvase [Bacillota bacterium]